LYAAKRSGRNRVAGPSDLSESLVDPRATRIDAAA
jgi:hypothetical protein